MVFFPTAFGCIVSSLLATPALVDLSEVEEPASVAEPAETTSPAEPVATPVPAPAEPAVSPAPALANLPPGYILDPVLGPLRRGVTVDFDVSLNYGVLRGAQHDTGDLVRARFGVLWLYEPMYPALGVTAELSSFLPAQVGIEGEILSSAGGTWVQLGVLTDFRSRKSGTFAVGWQTFGFEVDLRRLPNGDTVWCYFGKLRLPFGHFLDGLQETALRDERKRS